MCSRLIPCLNEALTRHVVKAQLTRHTHTHSHMHTGKRQQTRHAHTTASRRHCCKPSLFCACSLCPLHSLLARQQAASLSKLSAGRIPQGKSHKDFWKAGQIKSNACRGLSFAIEGAHAGIEGMFLFSDLLAQPRWKARSSTKQRFGGSAPDSLIASQLEASSAANWTGPAPSRRKVFFLTDTAPELRLVFHTQQPRC